MGTSSILIDCQVARTLGSSQKEVETYTAIRYALRCDGSSVSQVLAAVKELELMPGWARAASLPDVCRLARGQVPAITNAIHESVFKPLLEVCPERLRPSVANCIGEFPEGSLTEILLRVRQLADLLTQEMAQDESDQTLFSLERNEEVTFLLAMLENLIVESPEEVPELLARGSNVDTRNGTPLDLLDRCLGGDFGRTQLLQAVDVCLQMGELHRARDGLDVIKIRPEREVDLLHRHARLAYLSSSDAGNGDVVGWATKELVRLSALQRLARSTLEGESRPPKLEALSFWQDAVMGLVRATSPAQARPVLGRLFKPRVIEFRSSMVLSLPGRSAHPRLLADLFRHLLWEAGDDVDSIRFDRAAPPASYAIVPWFHPDKKRMRPNMPWLPHAGSLFIRMASWSVLACELLTNSSDFNPDDEGTRYLGFYLLHAYHWLDALDRAVRQGRYSVEDEIYRVAAAARLLVEQVAGGRYEIPSPSFFVQLTNSALETGFFRSESDEFGVEDFSRKRDSVDRQLETALVLSQRALAVTEDEPRAGRWLNYASDLSESAIKWFSGRKRISARASSIPRCFKRFFERSSAVEDEDADPLDAVRKTGTWTATYDNHRAVLVREASRFLDWTCGEDEIPVAKSSYAAPLTVGIQRLVAVLVDPQAPIELRNKWLVDFRRLLAAANNLPDFDRFLQCRFVEVLKMRLLRSQVDLVAMIISRLLEFGSNYTFAGIVDWLQRDPVDSDADANLRVQIFDTLLRYIRALENVRVRTEEPQSPESRARHIARARVLEQLAAASLTPPVLTASILSAAREKRDVELARPLEDRGTLVPVEIDGSGVTRPISKDYSTQDLKTATVVAFDATRLTARRLGPPRSGPDGNNLFAGATTNPRSSQKYLGMVVAAHQFKANVLFSGHAQPAVSVDTPMTFKQGQLVSADCGPIVQGRFTSADVTSIRELSPIHRIERWTVTAAARSNSLGAEFRAQSPNGAIVGLTQQTRNLLAIFSLTPEFTSFEVRFVIDRDAQRASLAIGRFTDLLLDEAEHLCANPNIVLCLRSIVRTERGTISELEVETSPFSSYRLRPQSDLESATSEILEATLGTFGSDDAAIGLFIAMRLIAGEGGPRLSLLRDASSIHPRWSTTTLHAPFDDRNLKWRNLFFGSTEEDEASDVLAEALECSPRDEGRDDFLGKLPSEAQIHGFPQAVIVQFASRPRGGPLILAAVNRERDGSPYRGVLHADEVSGASLAELDTVALKRLINWLIDGEQERTFRIRAFVKNVSRLGLVRAFTAENLPVQLPAESLSLLPIEESPSSAAWASRDAIGRPRYRQTAVSPQFDISDVPEAAFTNNIARGVLTSIPLRTDTPCIIAWRVGESIEQRSLLIGNLADVARRRLDLGCRVTADRRSVPPCLTLEEPHIVAEALWQLTDPVSPPHPASFVGTANVDGLGLRDLFEVSPGTVTSAPVLSAADPIFSRFSAAHLTDCAIVGLTDWSGSWPPETFRHDPVWRTDFAVERRRGMRAHLSGFSATKRPATGQVRLTGYELEILGTPSKFRIRRRLRARPDEGNVHAHVSLQTAKPRLQINESERLRRERGRLLTIWRSAPYVEGRHDEERNVFMPSDPFAQRLIPEGVTIEASSFSRRSPTRPTSGYSRYRARVLLREGEPLAGSYVDVPAAGLEDLVFALGNPPERTVTNIDELALCYVGISQTPDGKILHLFEWGYGWWTGLDPENLRYKGRPIEEGELVLAFGDWIKSVRLVLENESTIISIEDTALSPPHVLYKQAEENILHVLRVSSSSDGDVRIDALDAFDSRQATSVIRPFHNSGAVMAPESARAIAKVLAKKSVNDGDRQTITVYGRMDRERFRSTGGTELVYRVVFTEVESKTEPDKLQPGDRIFVRAIAVKQLPNDLALRVSPLSDPETARVDAGAGDRKGRDDEWLVTRRLFSFDESALARITSGTGTELENRVLLVRLGAVRRGRLSLFHLDGAPPRSSDLLDGLLAQAGGRLFCVFAGRPRGDAKGAVLLEVRPGALIELERYRVEWPQESLEIGDILRIENRRANTGAPYRATFAIFNDRRYARLKRPVVALPKNPLQYLKPPFADDDATNEALANFGAGDFRQLSATLDAGAPETSTAADVLERFMSLPHPKLAWLQTEVRPGGRRLSTLAPDFSKSILVGRLEFERDSAEASLTAPRLRVASLKGGDPELSSLSIRWSEITFSDATAKQVWEAVSKAGWHYHDRQTIVWRRTSESHVIADYAPLERHSVKTGPLFFERNGDAATLRFAREQIDRHLIGFANLRAFLPTAQKPSARGVVAYTAPGGGLYVELIPGRIYELPSALCSSDERDSIGLDRLDWSVFGTGDRVGLRRAPEQTGRHGQEGVLLWWDHGVRNAIGPQGALMPRARLQEKPDSVTYGAGRFTVTLPTGPSETLPELAIVGDQPAVRPFATTESTEDISSILPPGTTLLLNLCGGQTLEIAGLPGFTPTPASETANGEPINWRADTFLSTAFSQEGDHVSLNWDRLLERMHLVGDTIPVTLERVGFDEGNGGRYISFSRRHQRLTLQEGGLARGSVIGFVDEGALVLLAVGGRYVEIPITRLVDGAPKALWREIVDTLARVNAKVWLRQIESRFFVGLNEEPSTRIAVRTLAHISSTTSEGDVAAGIVCVGIASRRLYWLPADEVGASRLTLKQLSAALPTKGPALDALRLPGGNGVSLIQDTRLRNELARLRPAIVTTVRLIPDAIEDASSALPQFSGPTPGKAVLARLTGSGLLISFLLEEDEIADETPMPAEIMWRWYDGAALRLTAVKRGKLRARSDIPGVLLQKPSEQIDAATDIIYKSRIDGEGNEQPTGGSSIAAERDLIERANALRRERICSLREALIVLRRLGQNASEAATQKAFWALASNIGKRALRSFALEPLARRHAALLRGENQEDVAPGLNQRVEELLSMLTSSSGSAPADQIAERLETLVLFATLHPQPDRANHLVHALSAALGGAHDLNVLLDGAHTIKELVTLLRPFGLYVNALSPIDREELVANTAEACARVEERLAEDDFDIPLPRGFVMQGG